MSLRTHFVLGIIGAPFGLEGFVKVKPFSGETGHFSRLDKVTLRRGEKEEIWELTDVISQGPLNSPSILMRFKGVNDPEAAGLFNGAEIIAEREYAAPLKNGEYYVEDLKGLEVIGTEGEALGHIDDVLEGGGGNLAEIKLISGEKRLAPFRKEFFGDVDIEGGKIILLEPWILE